jgi:hypothetical protein
LGKTKAKIDAPVIKKGVLLRHPKGGGGDAGRRRITDVNAIVAHFMPKATGACNRPFILQRGTKIFLRRKNKNKAKSF